MPRFRTAFALKPVGENIAAVVIGTSRMRKVSTFPVAKRESEWPHSAAEQHAASAGKNTKMSAIAPMRTPAMSAPMRNSGASRSRICPEK